MGLKMLLNSLIILCLPLFSYQLSYSQQMCTSNAVYDCSFQIANSDIGSCEISSPLDCKKIEFNDWNYETVMKFPAEKDASFTPKVLPYAGIFYKTQKNLISAINITFTSLKHEINGFFIILADQNEPLCKIIDYRKALAHGNIPDVIFYDCFHNLVESQMQYITMKFRALPLNEELSYEVFVPKALASYTSQLCEWQPLIMVSLNDLKKKNVHVKFSQAPAYFNISSYLVNLIPIEKGNYKKKQIVLSNPAVDLLSLNFTNINGGYYFISVKLGTDTESFCETSSETTIFYIEGQIIDTLMVAYICVSALLGVPFIFVILFLIKRICKLAPTTSRQVILLIYSYDSIHHYDVISAFKNYLKNVYELEVLTLYDDPQSPIIHDDSGSPIMWIKECYEKANIIMFIISEGLCHTLEKKFPPVKDDHHRWHDQLANAEGIIYWSDIEDIKQKKRKKFCKICFSYSSKEYVPKCLKTNMGQCYNFPQQIYELLCFIHDYVPKIPFSKFFYQIFVHDFRSIKEGLILQECINKMHKAVEANIHIHYEDISEDKIHSPNMRPLLEFSIPEQPSYPQDDDFLAQLPYITEPKEVENGSKHYLNMMIEKEFNGTFFDKENIEINPDSQKDSDSSETFCKNQDELDLKSFPSNLSTNDVLSLFIQNQFNSCQNEQKNLNGYYSNSDKDSNKDYMASLLHKAYTS